MKFSVIVAGLLALSMAPAEVWILQPPLGLDLYMTVPESNPITRAKSERGRELFFDRKLSHDETLACASCHDPKRDFSDGRALPLGIGGSEGVRNAPALFNRGYGRTFFWDGRAQSLETQVVEPIFNPKELGLTERELERRTGMSRTEVAAALATYVRTIRSGDSRFDRYASGETNALDAEEKAGLALFRNKGNCVACHVGPNFTDEKFHNTGIAWQSGRLTDVGRYAISGEDYDRGAFKTPTLRALARTAPYMHDGSLSTLEDVVEFYSNGGRPNPYLDEQIRPRDFSPTEKRALLAFLRSLTGRVREGLP